jgi:peptidase inhibitor I9
LKVAFTRLPAVPNHYIVILQDDVAPDYLSQEERRARVKAIADETARKYQGKVTYIYETALRGYSIELGDEADAIAISKLPVVRWVEEDAIAEVGHLQRSSR